MGANADIYMWSPTGINSFNVHWEIRDGLLARAYDGTDNSGSQINGYTFTLYDEYAIETDFEFDPSTKKLSKVAGIALSGDPQSFIVQTSQVSLGVHIIDVDAYKIITGIRFLTSPPDGEPEQHGEHEDQQKKLSMVLTSESPVGSSGLHHFYFRTGPFPSLVCVHDATNENPIELTFGSAGYDYAEFVTTGKKVDESGPVVDLCFSFTPLGAVHEIKEKNRAGYWKTIPAGRCEHFWIHSGDDDNDSPLYKTHFTVHGRADSKAGGNGMGRPSYSVRVNGTIRPLSQESSLQNKKLSR